MINNGNLETDSIRNFIPEWDIFNELNKDRYYVSDGTNYDYGTAGFRMNASLMNIVCFRIGLLAGLLSLKRGKAIGIMITASHNPEHDNGIKIVESTGEMLRPEWEEHAKTITNAASDQLSSIITGIVEEENIAFNCKGFVVLGRDNRKSGFGLSIDVIYGIKCITGCSFVDYACITTPQLHFFVTKINSVSSHITEDSYYAHFGEAFKKFLSFTSANHPVHICVDAANGVGGAKIEMVNNASLFDPLKLDAINTGPHDGALNLGCGADFVKMQQQAPCGAVEHLKKAKHSFHYCSWDGDADRIVYYYFDEHKTFHLIDGDKMAALFCVYIKRLLEDAKVECSLGVVQTAYANGSSTQFFRSLGIEPEFTGTGVKNLHHASKKYDIGIYFEANGHGTITINDSFRNKLNGTGQTAEQAKLDAFLGIVNWTVGDAFSDMLLVEAILVDLKMTIVQWDKLYNELPNVQSKLKVHDKTIFETTDADRTLVSPIELQHYIGSLLQGKPNSRCFVRPSGTEDIIRVYCECPSSDECNQLNERICKFVLDNYSK